MTERQVTSRLKTQKKAPKTPTKTAQLKACDVLFGRVIRARGGCEACGSRSNLQCAHGFSRRYRATRWDERHCFSLCRGCHFRFTVRPLEWDEFMRDRLGEVLYEELRDLALTGPNPDLAVTFARLTQRWAQIQEEAA